MPFDVKAHLKMMVETHAPSGHEDAMRDVLRDAWSGLVDEMQTDKLGSLIGVKRGTPRLDPPRRIMLAAHMDEIGMMVRDIVDGFIFVHNISGVDNRIMPAQTVLVHGRRALPGVVAAAPPHLLTPNDRQRFSRFDELIIDVGLPAAEVEAAVRIGDLITIDAPMIELLGQKVAGKAMDDRACVAAVTVCLNELQNLQHRWDVYAAATVQEEMGLYGAATAAYHIQPDIAIALDVTFAPQPGVDSDTTCEIGGGPGIGIGPNFHPKLVEKIKDVAKRYEFRLQDDIIPGASGTDAWAIQVAHEGIPTILLEVPIRNMHSPVETADLRDITRAGRLMARFIAELDVDFLRTIEYDSAVAS
ncbi:MAG: M20/M25/M40 family metallo-hydrolase [Anaerolineae bacterium]|nr:M20/M25/M40 family metallo-hydrolase [Anaerolineae bacterium]NUQ03525.1 M20/M25/M40 family metallo-hydrolase [Anaerolineae bacterium]